MSTPLTTKIKFQPVNGYIVVKQDDKEKEQSKTESGIIINTNPSEKEMMSGIVVAVHHECERIKIDMRVQWQPFRTYPVKVEGETYLTLPEAEVHGFFTDK